MAQTEDGKVENCLAYSSGGCHVCKDGFISEGGDKCIKSENGTKGCTNKNCSECQAENDYHMREVKKCTKSSFILKIALIALFLIIGY